MWSIISQQWFRWYIIRFLLQHASKNYYTVLQVHRNVRNTTAVKVKFGPVNTLLLLVHSYMLPSLEKQALACCNIITYLHTYWYTRTFCKFNLLWENARGIWSKGTDQCMQGMYSNEKYLEMLFSWRGTTSLLLALDLVSIVRTEINSYNLKYWTG